MPVDMLTVVRWRETDAHSHAHKQLGLVIKVQLIDAAPGTHTWVKVYQLL